MLLDTSAAFTRLNGALLISMMHSSNLGSKWWDGFDDDEHVPALVGSEARMIRLPGIDTEHGERGELQANTGLNSVPLSSVEIFDPTSAQWLFATSRANARTQHTATLMPDGRLLVVGGAGPSSLLGSSEVFDISHWMASLSWGPALVLIAGVTSPIRR